MSATLSAEAVTKPPVSFIFNGKSADQGYNVQNFRKFHKVAQEVVDATTYHTCHMVLHDTTGGLTYDQVKALDTVFSKGATDTFYAPRYASFKDPLLKVIGPGKHVIVFSKKEYVTDWEIVANEDDTLTEGAESYDEQNVATQTTHSVQVSDTADKPAQRQSTPKSKKNKPSEAPATNTPTHPATSQTESTFPLSSTAERLPIKHVKRQATKHAIMWTDLKAKHKALATRDLPAGTITTQRDYWIDVFVHIFPDMDDEERGARILALRACESKHAKKNWSAKWKALDDVSETVDRKVWAPVFLDLTKAWKKYVVNATPKPIAPANSLGTTTYLVTGQTLNDFEVPEADFVLERVSAPALSPAHAKAGTEMETDLEVPKLNSTFDAAASFMRPFALQTVEAALQQILDLFANPKLFPEAKNKTPKEHKSATVVGQSLTASPAPKQSTSTLEPRTLSIFDSSPLLAGLSPFNNPFSKLNETAKSTPAPSVLDELSPSASAHSNTFTHLATSFTPSNTLNFRSALKMAEKKAAATTKLLPSSLVVNGNFHVSRSNGFEVKTQKLGGGQNEEVVVVAFGDEVVVDVDALEDSQIFVDLSDQTSETEEGYGTAHAKQLPACGYNASSPVGLDVIAAPGDMQYDRIEDDDESGMLSAYEWLTRRGDGALSTVRPEDLHLVHHVVVREEDDTGCDHPIACGKVAVCVYHTKDDGEKEGDELDIAEDLRYEDDANHGIASAYEQLTACAYDISTTDDELRSPINSVFDGGLSSEGTWATTPELDLEPEADSWWEYERCKNAYAVKSTHHRLPDSECSDDEQFILTIPTAIPDVAANKVTHEPFGATGPLLLDFASNGSEISVSIQEDTSMQPVSVLHFTAAADTSGFDVDAIELEEAKQAATVNAAITAQIQIDESTKHPIPAPADAATIVDATEMHPELDPCYGTACIFHPGGQRDTIYNTFRLPKPTQAPVANELDKLQLELDGTPLEDLKHWANSTFDMAFGSSGAPQIPALDFSNTSLLPPLDAGPFSVSSFQDQALGTGDSDENYLAQKESRNYNKLMNIMYGSDSDYESLDRARCIVDMSESMPEPNHGSLQQDSHVDDEGLSKSTEQHPGNLHIHKLLEMD
jgi:hypothetical protein